jgi:hypothetical protein
MLARILQADFRHAKVSKEIDAIANALNNVRDNHK